MPTLSRNHKPLPELDVDPAQIPALGLAARDLPGVSEPVAKGFTGWLVLTHAGAPSPPGDPTAVRYRKILRRLLAASDGGPPSPTTSKRRRGEKGHASPRLVGKRAAYGALAMTAASGHPAALLAAPIMFDRVIPEGGREQLAA